MGINVNPAMFCIFLSPSFFFSCVSCQVDVDMHSHFSYMAQRGIAWGFGMAEKLDLALAFLIEGRAGHEQPEVRYSE